MKEIEFTDDEFKLLTDLTYKIAIAIQKDKINHTDKERELFSVVLNKIESVNHKDR